MKKLILLISPIAIIILISYLVSAYGQTREDISSSLTFDHMVETETSSMEPSIQPPTSDSSTDDISVDTTIHTPEIELDPTSIQVLVNKHYTLEPTYEPDDLTIPNIAFSFSSYDPKMQLREEAAKAIEVMFDAAKQHGLTLAGVSGYRSYERQFDIYASNLIRRGVEFTNQYSAMAGASEHQTGLAMDISTPSIQYRLADEFANTPEGNWIATNCHLYGFIIRFPKDKSHVTGYSYEPWHIRYVGIELATYLTEHDLTLDEYYGYEYDDQIYKDVDYNSIIDAYNDKKGISSIIAPTQLPIDQDLPMDDLEILEDEELLPSQEPSPTTEPSPTDTPTITKEPKPTDIPTPSPKPKPTDVPTPSPKPEPTDTPTPSPKPEPMDTPTPSPETEPTDVPTDIQVQTGENRSTPTPEITPDTSCSITAEPPLSEPTPELAE